MLLELQSSILSLAREHIFKEDCKIIMVSKIMQIRWFESVHVICEGRKTAGETAESLPQTKDLPPHPLEHHISLSKLEGLKTHIKQT